MLAATNRPHAIDAALMRPGRFDLVTSIFYCMTRFLICLLLICLVINTKALSYTFFFFSC